ncbi:MAG: Type 1 glutamine amidotransferase-like domain-containing protein [Christensenellaceae bacterium]|jgi:dipeptidase E|nr:Type 1 glutamine amidotransferase-like domain-containing protein [Christensenellaceae bacterium]
MKLILASDFNNIQKDQQGNKYAVPFADSNLFLTNIKKYTLRYKNLVFIVSNPETLEINNFYGNLLFESLKLSKIDFEKKTILDNRNKNDAPEIIKDADLIFLSGGKVDIQSKFLNEINLNEHLKNYTGLLVGASSGAMNLCNRVVSFPENLEEINKNSLSKYFLNGLGFFDKIIIPHFDGENKKYTRGGTDAMKYLLELSVGNEIIAFNNDSYIFLADRIQYFGNIYIIKNKKVNKLEVKK